MSTTRQKSRSLYSSAGLSAVLILCSIHLQAQYAVLPSDSLIRANRVSTMELCRTDSNKLIPTFTYRYDTMGRVTLRIGPIVHGVGPHESYTYDSLSRITSHWVKFPDGRTFSGTETIWDTCNCRVEQFYYGVNDTVHPNIITHYDNKNRIVAVDHYANDTLRFIAYRYGYDNAGNIVFVYDSSASSISHFYPGTSVTIKFYRPNTTTLTHVYTETYTPEGKLSTVCDSLVNGEVHCIRYDSVNGQLHIYRGDSVITGDEYKKWSALRSKPRTYVKPENQLPDKKSKTPASERCEHEIIYDANGLPVKDRVFNCEGGVRLKMWYHFSYTKFE